jgi:hypothetical protein
MFQTWLTAWLLGVAAVVSMIAASWSLTTNRTLKHEGAPDAGRILRRRWGAPTGVVEPMNSTAWLHHLFLY